MDWELKYGDDETQRLIKAMKADGLTHPALVNKPELRRDCIRYFDAFRVLGSGRLWSQVGPQPIQISEVSALLEMYGIEEPETKLKYMRLIRRMDRVELKFLNARMRASTSVKAP